MLKGSFVWQKKSHKLSGNSCTGIRSAVITAPFLKVSKIGSLIRQLHARILKESKFLSDCCHIANRLIKLLIAT